MIDDIDRLLGMNQAWTLADTLDQLVEAARHLLVDHDCDQHGHELVRGAALRGAEYADKIRIFLTQRTESSINAGWRLCKRSRFKHHWNVLAGRVNLTGHKPPDGCPVEDCPSHRPRDKR